MTGNAAASSATAGEAVARTRRRARKPSPEALLIREHYNEIIERIRRGEKPSAIAVWLRQFGYQGTAAALNTTFGEDVRLARQASEQTRPRG